MSKSLNFELGLSIIKAKKEVDKFVQDTNKKMGKLKTEIKVDSREADKAAVKANKDAARAERERLDDALFALREEQDAREEAARQNVRRWQGELQAVREANAARVASAAAASKELASQEAQDYQIRLAQLKTEQEAREAVAQANARRWQEDLDAVKASNAANAGRLAAEAKRSEKLVEMRKASIARIEKSEIAAGGSTLEVRKKYTTELEKILSTSNERSLKDTQTMIRKLEVEYSKLNRMGIKDQNIQAKVRRDNADKETKAQSTELKKQQDAVKKHNEKIAEIRTASLARVERGEIAAGGATLAARKKYTLELERILATSNDRTLEDTRQMIRTLEAEYARLNRMAIKDQNLTSPGIGGGLQTRNIGRQVNMMFNLQQAIEDFSYAGMRGASNNLATMAASLGGKAGIAGMAALAAYNVYQLGDALGWFGGQTEKTTEKISKQIRALKELRDEHRQRQQDYRGLSSGSAQDEMRDKTLELEDERVELRRTQTELGRLHNLEKEIIRLRKQPRTGVVDGATGQIVDERMERMAIQARKDAEKLLKDNVDLLGDMTVGELFGEAGRSGLKEVQSLLGDSRTDEKKRIGEIRDVQVYIEHLKSLAGLEKDIAENRERITGTSFSGINVDDLPHAKKRMEEFVEYEKERLEVIEDSIEARKLDIDVLNRRGEYEKAKKATEDLVEETKKWAEETVNASKAAKLLFETHSETYKIVSDVADEVKRIADESHRAATAAWDQVEAMKAAKVASQRSFESTVFGARNSILDKQAQEEIQKRQSQLGSVEGRQKYDEFWVKYMFGDSKRTQWLIKERAKLIGQFHSQAMQDIQTQVERERSKRADKLLNDRIGVLQDRSKSQTKAGDFQGSLTTLQEMQGLYLSAMGSAGSSAQMRSFLQRAEDVQKQMDAVHDKNIERETEAAEKATERARQAQELLDQSLKTKEAIESLDPNANGALDKLLQMQNMLEQMRLDAEGIKMSLEGNGVAFNGFGPIPGGNQVAGVGGGNNITNINVASINTNAANAGSLVTDLNAQAKRKGIMVG